MRRIWALAAGSWPKDGSAPLEIRVHTTHNGYNSQPSTSSFARWKANLVLGGAKLSPEAHGMHRLDKFAASFAIEIFSVRLKSYPSLEDADAGTLC